MRTILLRSTIMLAALAASSAQVQSQAGLTIPAPNQTSPILLDIAATQAFEQNVADYVALHRLLEGPLPPLRPTVNMEEIRRIMQALAQRIQAARHEARQGDVITPAVARMFRRHIVKSLSPEQWQAILEDQEELPITVPVPPLRVNAEWPVAAPFVFVPPQLLAVLPPLPPELQYRIIGRSLVLWDHHANIIVDFLPRAFTT